MDIALSEPLGSFVREQVEQKRYASTAEVVEQALYLLRDYEQLREIRMQELRREVQRGIEQADRGETAPLDAEAIKAEGRRRLMALSETRAKTA